MPIQAPQWTEFLSCPVCCNKFDTENRGPITLGCGHSICRGCLTSLHREQCPFDQAQICLDVSKIPLNGALVKLVGGTPQNEDIDKYILPPNNEQYYYKASHCIQELVMYLKPFSSGSVSVLSRPMQRKLVTLANCQLLLSEGRARALRAARSLGERTVTELLLQHQNHQQLSANLWAAVRTRGCQFLGPAMQEEVLKLVLLALEDGSALSRKVLVMFVVQRLEPHYSQASKTSIGHVVQLLYRASCFKVSKREGDSSLMQLKEEFRCYDSLRREHDAQIVQIATEAGLRIAPDQWSALLYGDIDHKSHMQSIMDKLQTPQSFFQSVQELIMALQRSGDPGNISPLGVHLQFLASIDLSVESSPPSMEKTAEALEAAKIVVAGLVEFISQHGNRRQQESNHSSAKYKISMCKYLTLRGSCPRRANCTFAHSESELDKFRGRHRKVPVTENNVSLDSNILPNLLASSPSTALYDQELYTLATPQNMFIAPPPYTPMTDGVTGEPHWFPTDKMMGVNCNRNLTSLRLGKSEIVLLPRGVQHTEGEEFIPFDHSLQASKFGPISRQFQENHPVQFEDSPCIETIRKVNALTSNWLGRFSVPTIPQFENDVHYCGQTPKNLVAESQLLKQQKRSLEKKFMDLNLEEIYEAGIAEDMKELEQRLESELAEQERRWSEADPRPFN
ncbi:Roquin-1 [Polyplax serrata]|uniref:RING-type E3 ubiquitin transferase n=1 Tax=Polyplax serrata TaxID=468196 RepID=A0ABR1AV32_POLSC